MPPSNIRKSRRQRGRRGKTYLLGTLVVIIIMVVGWYAYASSQSPNPVAAIKPTTGGTTSPTTGSGTGANCADTTDVVYARLNTSQGLIEVELYQNATPKTVTNFVNLARSGFYDNLVWHRIVKGFVIQTGDPNTRNGGGDRSLWGTGGSSQTVPLEICSSLHNYTGFLGMARSSDPNSGSSQFYINLADNNSLDGQYTVFGRVTSGIDVAYAIANVPTYHQDPYKDQPVDPVFLTSVTVS